MFPRALIAAVLLTLVAAVPASADLQAGSLRPILVGAGKERRLAMPLPTVRQAPTLGRRDGRIVVRARVDYRAANWHKRAGILRDRAMVTLQVARRLHTTGPDPAAPRYRQSRVHLLGQRLAHRRYRWVLPRPLSRSLIRAGAFSRDTARRSKTRKRVWIDVEQDRDFQQVDGAYDWRQGRAANAGERSPSRLTAVAAASNNPSGTLTVQNATSWGFYVPTDQITIDAAGYPSAPATTVNNTGVPLLVGSQAIQCFDSGTSSSNPAAFNNEDAAGTGQPYAPGAVVAGDPSNAYPFSTGFAVTAPIAADDSIAKASNNETADVSAYLAGTLNIAFAAASVITGGAVPSGFLGGTDVGFLITGALDVDTIPSPGTIVSAFVDIADAIIAASCDGNANLLGLVAIEPGGGAVANNMQIQENVFGPFDPQSQETSNDVGYTAPIGGLFGLQANASTSTYQGSPLFLDTSMVGEGVFGNIGGSGANYVGINWSTGNPCPGFQQPASACVATPASTPPVADSLFSCGSANQGCPFPSAGFPAGTGALPSATSATAPSKTTISGTSVVSNGCATQVPPATTTGVGTYAAGTAVFSPDGAYELLMTSAGVLELIDTQSDQIVWSEPGVSANSNTGPTAGSSWSIQADGNLVIYDPAPGGASWASNTAGNTGAFLAVQNDGNVVLYNAAGTLALWSTQTTVGAACPAPANASAAAASGPSDSCATLIPATDSTYPSGTTFNSPNGRYQLIMISDGVLQLSDLQTSTPVWNTTPSYNQPSPATPAYSYLPGGGFSVTASQGIVAGQFSTNVSGPGLFVAVQNDGNLVVYSATGSVLWATGTSSGTPCPAPTIPAAA